MKDAPQELVDLVVDFAHDNYPILCAARLVSRAWNVSARVHLFRRLDLLFIDPPRPPAANLNPQQKSGADRIKWLLDILHSSSSPDTGTNIAYFVREVAIGNTDYLITNEQWSAYERLLPAILSILPHITTLLLHRINWNRFSHSTPCIQAIKALCQTPEFKHLDMWNCDLPSVETLIHVVNFSGNLESLQLAYIRFVANTDSNNVGTALSVDVVRNRRRQRTPLWKLTLDRASQSIIDALLTTPNRSFDITQLRYLFLNYVANNMPSVRRLLHATGHTLQHLQIRGWFFTPDQPNEETGHFNLSLTPQLQSLRISGLQWTPRPSSIECLPPLFDIHIDSAGAISSFHPLEYLYISVVAIKRKNQSFDMTQWTFLDALLSQPPFSTLKMFTLTVHVGTIVHLDDVDDALIASAFPNLQATKKIYIRILGS